MVNLEERVRVVSFWMAFSWVCRGCWSLAVGLVVDRTDYPNRNKPWSSKMELSVSLDPWPVRMWNPRTSFLHMSNPGTQMLATQKSPRRSEVPALGVAFAILWNRGASQVRHLIVVLQHKDQQFTERRSPVAQPNCSGESRPGGTSSALSSSLVQRTRNKTARAGHARRGRV